MASQQMQLAMDNINMSVRDCAAALNMMVSSQSQGEFVCNQAPIMMAAMLSAPASEVALELINPDRMAADSVQFAKALWVELQSEGYL